MKGYYIEVTNNLLEPKHQEAMKESVWLFMWLLDKMTSISEEGIGKVLGGKPIKYEEVKNDFNIARTTYVRWIKILENGKYIKTTRTPAGLVFYVNKAKKVFGRDVPKIEHHSDVAKKVSDVPKMDSDVAKTDIQYKTIQLHNKNNTDIQFIFEYWNEQNIIVHSKLTDKIKTKIISTLKDYSQKDILLAIRKYKIVLDGSEYFWTYRWTLQEFLSRGLTKFLDTPIDNFKKSNGFEKPKKEKRYYQGNPVVSKNGKDYVISGGEWLEFAGEDKDIEVRYE
jgi:hypothetical protein